MPQCVTQCTSVSWIAQFVMQCPSVSYSASVRQAAVPQCVRQCTSVSCSTQVCHGAPVCQAVSQFVMQCPSVSSKQYPSVSDSAPVCQAAVYQSVNQYPSVPGSVPVCHTMSPYVTQCPPKCHSQSSSCQKGSNSTLTPHLPNIRPVGESAPCPTPPNIRGTHFLFFLCVRFTAAPFPDPPLL